MNIQEKLRRSSREELDRYCKSVLDFSCIGIECTRCIFSSESGHCIMVNIVDEFIYRANTAE